MLQVLKNRLFYHKDSMVTVFANYRFNDKTVIVLYSYTSEFYYLKMLEMFANQEEYQDTIVVVYNEFLDWVYTKKAYLLSFTLELKLELERLDIDIEVNIVEQCQGEMGKCSELLKCYRKMSQELKEETPNDETLRHYEDYYYERTIGIDYSLR
jgi:hypothetical protein